MQIIRCYADHVGDKWDVFLPYALFAYRIASQSTARESPFRSDYSSEPVLPIDLLLRPMSDADPSQEQYTRIITAKWPFVWDTVRETIASKQVIQKAYYDLKAAETDIIPGDKVLKKVKTLSGAGRKMMLRFYKLYPARFLYLTNAEIVPDAEPDKKPQTVVLINLKKYVGPWLFPAERAQQDQVEPTDDEMICGKCKTSDPEV